MACVTSHLSKRAYLDALKSRFENPGLSLEEHVTGFVLGPFFCVAHHNPWEWNRKITAECTRAYGFVREEPEGTKAHYVNSRGLLCPSGILLFTLLCEVMFLASGYGALLEGLDWLISAGIAVLACLVSAVECTLTEAGEESARKLYSLLEDPEKY